MDKNTLAFLATPYSRYLDGLSAAHIVACLLAARLIRAGINVYCPIAESHPIARYAGIDPLDQAFWLTRNEVIMRRCDSLIVAHLDGWDSSSGIAWEIERFTEWGKPIYDLEPPTLLMVRREAPRPQVNVAQLSICGND